VGYIVVTNLLQYFGHFLGERGSQSRHELVTCGDRIPLQPVNGQ
jgi:hypothetical protein